MRRKSPKGFTLIELLVVIAIIAVLIGLLLPAVQKVREASARSQCQNNLHQLAVANMNYESVHGSFVPGVGRNGCCWGTWMVPILPFLEEDNLYKLYVNFGGLDYGGGVPAPPAGSMQIRYNAAPNNQVSNTQLKKMTCPSDVGRSGTGTTFHNYAVNTGNSSLYQVNTPIGCATGSAGCTTFGGAPFNWYNNDPAALAAGGDSTTPYNAGAPPNGPDAAAGKMGRPVRVLEITDGTSTTMMASEVLQGRGGDLRGFTWWGGAAGFSAYLAPNSNQPDVITGGTCVPQTNPPMPCTTTATNTAPRMVAARSQHTAGVNVAMCDGSVRFVPNSISMTVWQAISTSQGREATTDF